MQTQEGAAVKAQREGVVDSLGGTGETLETFELNSWADWRRKWKAFLAQRSIRGHDDTVSPGDCECIWRAESRDGDWAENRSQGISWDRLVKQETDHGVWSLT